MPTVKVLVEQLEKANDKLEQNADDTIRQQQEIIKMLLDILVALTQRNG